MEQLNTTLFNAISEFKIGSDGDALTFTDRLCRENNWSHAYAERCVDEYKKFVYLAMVSEQSVTPSDEVDQVWHLHLTYTQSYWKDLCQGVLKRPLHHGPTQGGKSESTKYRHQYQATLDSYVEVFNQNPPLDIWPDCEQRFHQADKFVRLNTANYFLLKRPSRSLLAISTLPVLLAACVKSEGNSLIFVGLLLVVVGLYLLHKLYKLIGQHKNGNSSGGGCGVGGGGTGDNNSDGGNGGCGSGCGGCGG